MKKKILYALIILLIGFIGGTAADLFLPYLAGVPPFSYLGLIDYLSNGTTVINTTEEIVITENIALSEAIGKVSPSLVVVETLVGQVVTKQGTGFIVTADGLIVTASDLIGVQHDTILITHSDWQAEAILEKRDAASQTAVLRIDQSNLPVVSLTDLSELQLGQMVILVGIEKEAQATDKAESFYHFINIGHIRSFQNQTLSINIEENNLAAHGGPLIDIKGQVIGLNLFDSRGLIKTIGSDKIRKLIFD